MEKRKGSEKRKRNHRHSVRCNAQEEQTLLLKADRAGISIGSLFRVAALDMPMPRATRRPTSDQKAVVQFVGLLGRIASNFNQAQKHMNAGHPQWNIVQETCRAILEMKVEAMRALGREPDRAPD